ncbi:unnamed protein product [Fraxinus pennsylvanica]|uniref:Protein LAZ1-like n=1 Tax=Fraxinus pennsylvanica TaxID=56036 RepID=A0AAD2AH21_9LAMI|nr:unnamed protein product [Fraxinus pennsylvanica]
MTSNFFNETITKRKAKGVERQQNIKFEYIKFQFRGYVAIDLTQISRGKDVQRDESATLNGFASLVNPAISVDIEILRDCYESFAMYCFGRYLVACLGGEERTIAFMKREGCISAKTPLLDHGSERGIVKHHFPMNLILKPWKLGQWVYQVIKFGIVQYVIIKAVTAILAVILEAFGVYCEGDFKWNCGYPYMAVVLNFSQSWALYCLVQFYTITKYELSHINPLYKFLTFKSIVFLTWWQGVAIALLYTLGLFKSPIAQALQFKSSVQDFIICIEMGIASVVHLYVFPAKPYELMGDHFSGRVSVLGDYASVDCPLDPDEVRDSERPTKVRLPQPDFDIRSGMTIRESVRDVFVGGGEYIVNDLKFTVTLAVEPVEKGINKFNQKLHNISQNIKRHDKSRRTKDDGCIAKTLPTHRVIRGIDDPLLNGSLSDSVSSRRKKHRRKSGYTSAESGGESSSDQTFGVLKSALSNAALRRIPLTTSESETAIRDMALLLFQAQQLHYDSASMIMGLKEKIQVLEEQINSINEKSSKNGQIAAEEVPKSLYCLGVRLTTEWFKNSNLQRKLEERRQTAIKLQDNNLYHFCIFSNNVLATSVVVNSTARNSKNPENVVFHIVTDEEDFSWLNASYVPVLKQLQDSDTQNYYFSGSGGDDHTPLKFWNPKYLSMLNHLRFYIPEVFPAAEKVVFLDDDVVVQKDPSSLFSIDLNGNVNGAVETCRWRKRSVTGYWQEKNVDRTLWKLGTLPPGLLTFYGLTEPLNPSWHVLGLGYTDVDPQLIKKGVVLHYNGNSKPWLKIGMEKYKPLWDKYVDYSHPLLQQCNAH